MARNRAHDLTRYSFSSQETLLLDTNVWLYLFPAPSNPGNPVARAYSSAFARILQARVPLAMDVLVLCEYLNRYCRIEWEAVWRAAHPKYKSFRCSGDFAGVGQVAATYARRILGYCTRSNHHFASVNVEATLVEFEQGAQDFNDGLLAEACRCQGWKLVTNDGDFVHGGIEVLTANRKLLRSCARS